jgi:HEAT repeat protein
LAAAALAGRLAGASERKEPVASTFEVRQAAERMVAEALRAEVAGETARRRVLLSEAIDAAPDYLPARWHSGQVLADGEWLPVDKAQQAAAADPKRAEYQQLRASGGDTLDGQLALARWCRKHGFNDEARFHWATVLSHEPNNDEALRALGVRWFGGRLMSFAEIEAAKERARESRRAAKDFAPQVARWERLLAAGDLLSRNKALDEIRVLQTVEAIPALEKLTLDQKLRSNTQFERAMQIGLALVDALNQLPNQEAAESLIRHALDSPVATVRESAVSALRERPPNDFVPMLLDALAMPIESSFRVATDPDGSVHYWHSLFHEGRHASRSVEGRQSAMQHDLQGPTYVTIINGGRRARTRVAAATNPAVTAEMAAVASVNQQQFGTSAAAAKQQIAQINQAITESNARIVPLLAATTGQDLGDNPRSWWDWWDRYNEYYSDAKPPVYEERYATQTHRYNRPPRELTYDITPPPPPRRLSCFAAGTLVWTKTGERPIETLEIGDLVLAQNVDTGERAFKPIIGRTVRPPSEIFKLSVDGEELETTLGHPLWVAGVGWRMAKELADGAILHGVNGSVRIDAVAKADEAEAYNLIVADFNTYFVGKSGVLVHDNTPRKPTTAIVPGLVKERRN